MVIRSHAAQAIRLPSSLRQRIVPLAAFSALLLMSIPMRRRLPRSIS